MAPRHIEKGERTDDHEVRIGQSQDTLRSVELY
jgi:hypothetical protein